MISGFSYVLENYIYVPAISAIMGALFSLLATKMIKCIVDKRKRIINKLSDTIDISGRWKSIFHEGGEIKTEIVNLKQEGQIVKGSIELNDRKYFLDAEFKNQILIGTYISDNRKKDERGCIVLRRINEQLLSGFCTFVYEDKQVYNSPYVLTYYSKHDAAKGTYSFCNTCVGNNACCCNSDKIDMPILLPSEVKKIQLATKIDVDKFAEKKTNNLYQMIRKNKDEKECCVFFVNNSCSIYDYRPIDCRLFPFDFKEIDGEYWLIYYNSFEVCSALPTDENEIKNYAYNIRPLLDMLLPYMSECSDPVFCTRLHLQNYDKLFSINSIKEDVTTQI